jgi:predicted nucleic acid-binding Zn ribbon protein
MPTYVYKCPKCSNELEQLLTVGEYATQPLPVCVQEGCDGHQQMKPQLQASVIKLRGTGFTPKFHRTK